MTQILLEYKEHNLSIEDLRDALYLAERLIVELKDMVEIEWH